jgi:lipoprotein-releasing system permease protein
VTRLEMGIAWRYMRSRRGSRLLSLISIIAVGGVLVGVSALIVIIGVMNGLQHDLREKILVASPDVRVLPWNADLTMSDWQAVHEKVRLVPGVAASSPFVSTEALVRGGGSYVEGAFVLGIPPQDSATPPVTGLPGAVLAGDLTFRTPPDEARRQQDAEVEFGGGAVLGDQLAARLQLTPGVSYVDLGTLNMQEVNYLYPTGTVRQMRFLVTGLIRSGMYQYDNKYVVIPLESAQKLAGIGSAVTGIEVRTPTRDEAPAVSRAIRESLDGAVRTEDWQMQNASLFHALRLEKIGMTFILLLIILVAAFNIVGTLSMVVADKTREIGILRAMGMPAAAIRRIFLMQGMIIGAVGTGLGLLLGLVASFAIDYYQLIPLESEVYFISHLPVMTEWLDVLWIVLASLGISVLATIYPARQAARLYPVEAIRHE